VHVAIPEGIRWDLWRVATHPRISDSMVSIQRDWTMFDVLIANELLDAFEAAEFEANRPR
jgi:hypothetical protein